MARFAQVGSIASPSGVRGRNLSKLLVAASAAILFLAIVAFFARQSFERRTMAWMLATSTGYSVDVGAVQHDGDVTILRALHARSPGGGVVFDAARVAFRRAGADVSLAMDAPRVTIAPARLQGDEWSRLLAPTKRAGLPNARVDVQLQNGAAFLVGSPAPALLLSSTGIGGTFHFEKAQATYDLSLALGDGNFEYPIVASAAADPGGGVVRRWYAATIPLSAFNPVLGADAGVTVTGGWLRDVTLTGVPSLRGTATLDAAALDLAGRNGRRHELRELSGTIGFDATGVGSNALRGTVDGIPVDAAGEVHDVRMKAGNALAESNDLGSLRRLVVALAEEPGVQSIHVETTAPGIAFAQYALASDHGPLAVQVISVDAREPTLSFDTALAGDHIISGGERTSAMGLRTKAVAGVNGDYFDIGRTYQPQGMLVHSGRLMRGPTDRYALVVRRDRSVGFAEFSMVGEARIGSDSYPVTQLNNWPAGKSDLTVITPDFGATIPPAANVRFARLVPLGGDRYRIMSVAPVNAPQPVTFGLAFGPESNAVLHPGQVVSLDYHLDPPIDDAVAGVGGGPLLLRDGAWFEDPHAPAPDERNYRWPVVALGRQRDGTLLLVAVDGRHPERSVGMTRPEFGALLQRLDVTDAMALDSGGSVTMVSRAPGDRNVSVRNVPSDFSAERWISDGLFIYSSAPLPTIVPPRSASTPPPEARPTP